MPCRRLDGLAPPAPNIYSSCRTTRSRAHTSLVVQPVRCAQSGTRDVKPKQFTKPSLSSRETLPIVQPGASPPLPAAPKPLLTQLRLGGKPGKRKVIVVEGNDGCQRPRERVAARVSRSAFARLTSGRRLAASKPSVGDAATKTTLDTAGDRIEDIPITKKQNKAIPFLDESDHGPYTDLHKPVGLILSSAYVLSLACQLAGAATVGWLPVVTGGAVGGLFSALNRFGMKRFWLAPTAQLNVVITGASRGLGKAIAREFLRCGDRVFITSRSIAGVRSATAELRGQIEGDGDISGIDCDVSNPAAVARLAAAAQASMGRIDVWINAAGYSGSYQTFLDATHEQLLEVVSTNLLGSLLCTRVAVRTMCKQEGGGHVFNVDGAGADGRATPQYVAYGATKAGIAQLMESVQDELQSVHGASKLVGVHTLSPGMVLTELLLAGSTPQTKQIFNILCEQPETVAAYLVPRVRTVTARQQTARYIRYLTIPRALLRFVAAPLTRNRYFNEKGEAVYLTEFERIMGHKAKTTARLAQRAAQRSRSLGLAYSLSIAVSFLLIVVSDSVAHGVQ